MKAVLRATTGTESHSSSSYVVYQRNGCVKLTDECLQCEIRLFPPHTPAHACHFHVAPFTSTVNLQLRLNNRKQQRQHFDDEIFELRSELNVNRDIDTLLPSPVPTFWHACLPTTTTTLRFFRSNRKNSNSRRSSAMIWRRKTKRSSAGTSSREKKASICKIMNVTRSVAWRRRIDETQNTTGGVKILVGKCKTFLGRSKHISPKVNSKFPYPSSSSRSYRTKQNRVWQQRRQT